MKVFNLAPIASAVATVAASAAVVATAAFFPSGAKAQQSVLCGIINTPGMGCANATTAASSRDSTGAASSGADRVMTVTMVPPPPPPPVTVTMVPASAPAPVTRPAPPPPPVTGCWRVTFDTVWGQRGAHGIGFVSGGQYTGSLRHTSFHLSMGIDSHVNCGGDGSCAWLAVDNHTQFWSIFSASVSALPILSAQAIACS